MLTGLGTRTVQRRLLALGVQEVLAKPANFDNLMQYIKRLASMSQDSQPEWQSRNRSELPT
jgi:DNA-binding response OmpR family regulator